MSLTPNMQVLPAGDATRRQTQYLTLVPRTSRKTFCKAVAPALLRVADPLPLEFLRHHGLVLLVDVLAHGVGIAFVRRARRSPRSGRAGHRARARAARLLPHRARACQGRRLRPAALQQARRALRLVHGPRRREIRPALRGERPRTHARTHARTEGADMLASTCASRALSLALSCSLSLALSLLLSLSLLAVVVASSLRSFSCVVVASSTRGARS